jgi:hypothetical protein
VIKEKILVVIACEIRVEVLSLRLGRWFEIGYVYVLMFVKYTVVVVASVPQEAAFSRCAQSPRIISTGNGTNTTTASSKGRS